MKVKVYLNRITIPYQDAFTKATQYFAKHGVNIQFDFQNISITGYQSVWTPISGGRWNLLNIHNMFPLSSTADVNIFIFDQNEWKTPQGSKYPLLPNTPNGCCYMANGKPFITIGFYQVADYIQICHETMHSLAFINKSKDVMDTYIDNANPDSPTGNFSQQWAILNALKKPVVTLTRNIDNRIETLGTLTYGNFTCKTLERPYKQNLPNISCIPTGQYNVAWTFSPKFLKYTYEIQAVPSRSGVRIHSGNFWFDVEGCILLGDSYGDLNKDGQSDILNSKVTVNAFETLLNKQSFTLIIK